MHTVAHEPQLIDLKDYFEHEYGEHPDLLLNPHRYSEDHHIHSMLIDDTPHWEVIDDDDNIRPLDIDEHDTELIDVHHPMREPGVHYQPAFGVPFDVEPHHEIEHHVHHGIIDHESLPHLHDLKDHHELH